MDKEQYEEILLNIIQIGQDLKDKLDNIEKAIKNNDISPNNMLTESKEDDLYGIPLNSVHHPNNPDYISNKKYFWNDKIKMWRPK
jgi:hypothetical protein